MDKVTNSLNIAVPQGSFVDEGDGVVSFPNGLTITDNSVQRNGTTYDIDSLDISRYGNQLTGDHEDRLSSLIGEVQGTSKINGKVVVNKIRYAIKENPYGRLAYDLLVGGFSKNFSTETIGPAPDPQDGVYRNAELVGLSQVVTQNNYNAHVNQFVHNSLERAKQDGLDVTGIEEKLHVNAVTAPEEDKMEEKETKIAETKTEVVNDNPVVLPVTDEQSTRVEAPVVVDAPKETETKTTETKTTETVAETKNEADKTVEDPKQVVETPHVEAAPVGEIQTDEQKAAEQINKEPVEAKTEVVKTEEVVTTEKETNNKEEKMEEKTSNSLTAEQVAEIVTNAMKPLSDKVSSLETEAKNAFDASAKEPEFKKEENAVAEKATNAYAAMDFETRYQKQVDAAWNAVKLNSVEAWTTLREINAVNLDKLKEAGIAKNSMGLDDLGNFVIAPEMYNQIVGVRNDYSPLINGTEWKETLSLEFAWLQRTGDIDMRSVALNATADSGAGANANLKPISEYAATPRTSALEELAAVTVVATSATRFAAVDLLGDAATGYRWDYDRKRAQLIVARLQQAVNSNGFVTGYNPGTSDSSALTAWLTAITSISDTTLNGTLVFNARTFAELKSRALRAGANGPLSEILTTGNLPTVFGYNFIIVPNNLMPSLGGSESIAHEVEGVEVPITCAVFFADLTTFTGRTSGGLQYDVSNSASYESGGVVKSAYQRNELVLRGSFFRGGAVKNPKVVAGVVNGAVS